MSQGPWTRVPLAVGLFVCGVWSGHAAARVYPVPILADNEDDLRLLIQDGVLEPDDFETLLELLANPVDLNRASRNQLYDLPGVSLRQAADIAQDRRTNGPYRTLADVKRVASVGPETLAQLRRFAVVQPKADSPRLEDTQVTWKTRLSYHIEDRSVYALNPTGSNRIEDLGYGGLPQGYTSVRVKHPWGVEAGFLGLAREQLVRAEYSAADRAIHGDWGTPALELGRVWTSVERGRYSAIAGHYTAGFGLGLTFDRTRRTRPQGWYPDMAVNTDIEDGDFRAQQTLLGFAGRIAEVPLGPGRLEATVFASSNTPDVYQYHIAVTGGEPYDPDAEDLTSPRVFIDGYPASYITLPNLWRETLAGANVELNVKERTRVGLTTYGAVADRTVLPGVPDNTELYIRQRVADTDRYGAAGVYLGQTVGAFDLTGEFSQSFSGGHGVLVMATYDEGPAEIELSGRRYSTDYDNPNARGIAAADVYRGMRDRDEQGVRLRTELKPSKVFRTRWMVDVWQNLESGRSNLEVFGRLQADPTKWLMVAVMGDHRNRDLANNGRTRIYGGDYDDELLALEGLSLDTSNVDIVEGAGSRNYVAGQVRFKGIPKTTLEVFHRRFYEDAGLVYPMGGEVCEPGFQIGQATWAKARVKASDTSTVTARWRIQDEDIHGGRGQRFTDAYLQAEQKLGKVWKATLRAGMLWQMDDPDAEWADSCDLVGRPDLEATCGASGGAVGDASDLPRPEALLLATLEAKFK